MYKEYYYQYINHYALVIDTSSSMSHLIDQMTTLIDKTVERLKAKSVKLNQETRLSIFTFADKVECVVFDVDVARLGSLAGKLKASGMTALMDGIGLTIKDLKTIPVKYGDHAFIGYVVTDGDENRSRIFNPQSIKSEIEKVNTEENWTLSVLVPNREGVAQAKNYGIPAECIETWNVTEAGLDKMIDEISESADNFMEARTQGVRGYKGLLKLKLSDLNQNTVKSNLQEVDGRKYRIYPVSADLPIRTFVEKSINRNFVKGSAYYQLTKSELIQHHKAILVYDKQKKKLYKGAEARQVLNLPHHDVKVNPDTNTDFDIFVQSTSVNRKLIKGQNLLIMSSK